ncbi:LCP family protein [Rhodococcoides fascians]|uniref:Regulatory protein MsrR n=2 Tax=Bacteria TaxID=2 RepID=A0A143QLT7_RHOFA|nr:LCP family protein [Rhodococcus fascians]AMY23891.1 Regulatory protein MsrR [Rhodococcus fascians]KMJ47297.1 LytR family transcriptional regulator [Rhodococcus fascians]OZC40838.1 LytR family transcriptional regulator [Rhodococcus fascians]
MGDDRESGPSVPEGRAPWERPLSSIGRTGAGGRSGQRPPRSDDPAAPDPAGSESDAPDSDSPPKPGDSGRLGKRSPRNADTVSVAELVDKMSRSGATRRDPPERPDVEEPTEVISPITDSTPPPGRANRPMPTPPPHAAPEPVGAPATDRPALTRLAMSRVRRRRRIRMIGRSLVSIVAILAVALTGVVWGYLRNTDQGFLQVAALDPDSTDVVDAAGQYGDETYLIVGTDTRAGASGQVGAGTVADAEGSRSDTVMLVNIPADRSRVVAVSFPRDLDVTRPECEQFDNVTNTYTGEMFPEAYGDKLNATYALGGPKCLVKTIQKISGLRIGHFVGMDFAGFESMVDEVGGVEVCTAQPLVDYELGDVLPNAGTQRIDGRTALNYVRARNIESEGNGDYGRIKRQQRFLSSLLRSALSNKVLLDPGKLNGFVNAFTSDTFVENVKTQDLVTLGRSLQNVDAGAVTFLTIPTTGTNDYGNEIPNEDAIGAIFQAIIDDLPLPGEERAEPVTPEPTPPPAAPDAPLLAVDPGTVSLQVSNASDIAGMAQTASDQLATYGFQILTVGNFSGSAAQTVVRYSQDQEAAAATVASAIPGAAIELAPSLNNVVEVVLGSNYPGYTQYPADVGAQIDPTQVEGTTESAQLPEDLSFTNAADDTCA